MVGKAESAVTRSFRSSLLCASVLFLALSVLAFTLLGIAASDDATLTVVGQSKAFPAVVTITAPGPLLDRAGEFRRKRAGICIDTRMGGEVGFKIDWGDDDIYPTKVPVTPGPDSCPDPLSHIYTVPGTYTIRATMGHLSKGDAFVRDWSANTEVTIDGPRQAVDISLLAPTAGAVFGYQPYVGVTWDLATDAPVDLTLEVISDKGTVLGSRTLKRLSYVGRGEATVQVGNGDYIALMQRDEVALARVRATLSWEGKAPLFRDGAPFTLTAELVTYHPPRTEALPGKPLGVRLFHYTYHADCYDYVIDWGDGSAPQRPGITPSPSCRGDAAWIETTHVYAQPGAYDIKIRSNNISKHIPIAAKPFYERATITVP